MTIIFYCAFSNTLDDLHALASRISPGAKLEAPSQGRRHLSIWGWNQEDWSRFLLTLARLPLGEHPCVQVQLWDESGHLVVMERQKTAHEAAFLAWRALYDA